MTTKEEVQARALVLLSKNSLFGKDTIQMPRENFVLVVARDWPDAMADVTNVFRLTLNYVGPLKDGYAREISVVTCSDMMHAVAGVSKLIEDCELVKLDPIKCQWSF